MEDELVGILGKLVEFVENASPAIWEIAQKQVVVRAAQTALWAVVLTIVCGVLVYIASKAYKYAANEDDDFFAHSVLVGVLAFVSGIVAIGLAADVMGYLINPAYYAIENILSMAK